MAEFEAENRLNEERVGDAVDVLLLEAPGDWPPLQRSALALALVWDVTDLIMYAAELSAVDALPAPLLWQAAGVDHVCASARVPVPGTDLLVWAKVDRRPFDGRPLWSQAATVGRGDGRSAGNAPTARPCPTRQAVPRIWLPHAGEPNGQRRTCSPTHIGPRAP
ncbi:hypothetical protein ACFRNT_42385 [Streptomyces sp. NPDC056697]|uniref:hypothetical protein n=1 Tax=Streptomyces sp. NPDC056697 TaxID=3345915 RepID=UPI0036BE8E21